MSKPPAKGVAFRSRRDVNEHLAGDRIKCLICGRAFVAVCHHARLAHGVSALEYKQRFGLPVGRGVASQAVRDKWSAAVAATREKGGLPQSAVPGVRPKRYTPPYARTDMRLMGEAEVAAIIGFVQGGETLTEACQHDGMPAWSWLHDQLRRDKALSNKFNAVIEQLPFSQQARMKKLGQRFEDAVRSLMARLSTAREIAAELGVSEEAVRRRIKGMKQ